VVIIALFVVIIGFLQNIMDLLEDVLNFFNEFGGYASLKWIMGRLFICGCKEKCYINGAQ
jgi:hypothetical protein